MQVVVVSGGSRGLGQSIVADRLERGDAVATFARGRTPFVAQALADFPERFHFVEADVADADAVGAFARGVAKRFGRIDALVNNAGLARDGLLATQSIDDIDLVLGVNIKGALLLARACLRPMLRAKKGRIVNISSIVGLRGYRGLVAYGATKGALDAMTRGLAREVGQVGITVNSIAPGYLETEMTHGLTPEQMQQIAKRTPVGRLGKPDDVLPLLAYLLSDASSYMTGQTLVIDGGITI